LACSPEVVHACTEVAIKSKDRIREIPRQYELKTSRCQVIERLIRLTKLIRSLRYIFDMYNIIMRLYTDVCADKKGSEVVTDEALANCKAVIEI
jgi:hypothetical protein